MKNTLQKTLLTLALLVFCLMLTGAALAESYGVVSNTNYLNLRLEGSSSSAWLGQYPRGTWVEIVGSQNNFYQVLLPDGKSGYMSKNYIDTSDRIVPVEQIAVVTNQNGGAYLNLRQQPSYNAKVLCILYNGVPLHVLSEQNGWYAVNLNGQVGYVRSEYVTVQKTPGSSTVATIKTPGNTPLNLRSGPGMHYPVKRQYSGDTYVMVLTEGNGWWRVAVADGYGYNIGFMDSSFLRKGLHSAKDVYALNNIMNSNGITAEKYALVSNPKPTQTLNLRFSASTASPALTQLRNNTRLTVNQQGSEWCHVTVQSTGQTGYVMTRYISLHNLPKNPTRKVVHPSGSYVNLRAKPDLAYGEILYQVSSGAQVNILIPGDDWCKVSYGGRTGYMLTYFLK